MDIVLDLNNNHLELEVINLPPKTISLEQAQAITVVISQVGEKGEKGDAGLTVAEVEDISAKYIDSKFSDVFGNKL